MGEYNLKILENGASRSEITVTLDVFFRLMLCLYFIEQKLRPACIFAHSDKKIMHGERHR